MTDKDKIFMDKYKLTPQQMKRVTAKKYGGDDEYSWAVFVDGKPAVTGLSKPEVSSHKRTIMKKIFKLNESMRLTKDITKKSDLKESLNEGVIDNAKQKLKSVVNSSKFKNEMTSMINDIKSVKTIDDSRKYLQNLCQQRNVDYVELKKMLGNDFVSKATQFYKNAIKDKNLTEAKEEAPVEDDQSLGWGFAAAYASVMFMTFAAAGVILLIGWGLAKLVWSIYPHPISPFILLLMIPLFFVSHVAFGLHVDKNSDKAKEGEELKNESRVYNNAIDKIEDHLMAYFNNDSNLIDFFIELFESRGNIEEAICEFNKYAKEGEYEEYTIDETTASALKDIFGGQS